MSMEGKQENFFTSKEVLNNSHGKRAFDINLTAILAFKKLRNGESRLETSYGYMNISSQMTKSYTVVWWKISFCRSTKEL